MANPNWQYMVCEIRDRAEIPQQLANYGVQGWELVQILESPGADRKAQGAEFTYLWTLVLKQPLT